MPPQTGHFILHSNVMPRLTAGRYQLRTRQDGTPFDVEPEVTHIQVSSPRYTMPTDQILSSFPPANAEGAFGERLLARGIIAKDTHVTTLRLAPPLVIDEADLDMAIDTAIDVFSTPV